MSSRTWAVIKREFAASVRTKTFVFGTLFGPVLMVGLILLPMVFEGDRGGERSIAIVDATGRGIGESVERLLPGGLEDAAEPDATLRRYDIDVVRPHVRGADALRAEFRERVEADRLHGVLWLPPGLLESASAVYEGENATSRSEMAELRTAVQAAVRQDRLAQAGVDPLRVTGALGPVTFEARQTGEGATSGTAESAVLLAFILGFAIYMVVIIYGQAVMRGVLEEKRDRIIEVMISSIRAPQLLLGKVLGIGGAGLLQVAIWVGFAAVVLTQGDAIAALIGRPMPELPDVPAHIGVSFVAFFTGGFFLYSVLYAGVGAIVTTHQEAQQLAFPVLAPLIAAIAIMSAVAGDPGGQAAVIGSLIPFTAPVIMPMRIALMEVPALELAASGLLLAAAGALLLWVAAKIYRIGMLATGKRPGLREVWRWIRTA